MKALLRILLMVVVVALAAAAAYHLGRYTLRQERIPPFALWPDTHFSRQEAIGIALREWRLFGQPVHDEAPNPHPDPTANKAERLPGLWERVGEYCWIGLDDESVAHRITGKHTAQGKVFPPQRDDMHAWSGAFIAYVMRLAGAGDGFVYSDAHADYINAARAADNTNSATLLLRAERLENYAPQPGDLICYARPKDNEPALHYDDLPVEHFASHCDIVVQAEPGQLSVIGGNVSDAVSMKHVPVAADGKLTGPDGAPIDKRYPWFVAIRVLYAE